MRGLGQALGVLFGLALLGAVGVGGYVAIKEIATLLDGVDSPVGRDAVVVSAVLLVAALAITRTIRQSRERARGNQLQSDKAATYRLFVDLRTHLLREGHSSVDGNTAEIFDGLQALTRLLALYGSPAVIKAHIALRALERDDGSDAASVRAQFGKALMEIRKDLGAKTLGLQAADLLELLLPGAEGPRATSEETSLDLGTAVATPS
jgi:hypothetical protein